MAKEVEEKVRDQGKLYQDQLYNTKSLSTLAVKIIDTPEFQRLDGIHQLGFANIVYRGAQHTRFSHSIGTYFLSRTIMRRIAQNHERLNLGHPGDDLPDCFAVYPTNAFSEEYKEEDIKISNQSKWRGLMEVVSIAALIHDIGHIPFGHTLEDEFTGIYNRHDSLAGPRLYELLFGEQSSLTKIFSGSYQIWIKSIRKKSIIKNEVLAQLIYVILSWKEKISPSKDFDAILKKKKEKKNPEIDKNELDRIEKLKSWYNNFKKKKMFHPFMTDVIGNTICSDLLDYLPRDRMNLGMEYRHHERIQRYLTIREGTLYQNEGKRISIMVTRRGHGGQRRDVATAVLDIMRERYEMAERVFYHHKKAAASTMLAKLAELCGDKPKDDGQSIYPAPWSLSEDASARNLLHFSDTTFIDYLGKAKVKKTDEKLQKKLYVGIRFDRNALYQTLIVVDNDLVEMSTRPISYFALTLRKDGKGNPSNVGRQELEKELAKVAKSDNGEVLVYCPAPEMQSKEVDARLEIVENRVLPLSVQKESFAYHDDIKVLEQYYQQLWRIYIFVSPELFKNAIACQAIVDKFCDIYDINKMLAYDKVRRHDFKIDQDVMASKALKPLHEFLNIDGEEGISFNDIPTSVVSSLLSRAEKDKIYLQCIKSGSDPFPRISSMLEMAILDGEVKKVPKSDPKVVVFKKYISGLESEEISAKPMAARSQSNDNYLNYVKGLVELVITFNNSKS